MPQRAEAMQRFRPEVGRLWMRVALRRWPGPEGWWTDLAAGRVRRGGSAAELPAAAAIEVAAGPLYLPPVDAGSEAELRRLVAALEARGASLLLQRRLEDEPLPEGAAARRLVIDPVQALLERRPEALAAAPAGATVVWPLIAGLTDDEALWDEGCRALRRAGARCAQALTPEVTPAERRALAREDAPPEVYGRLFHRDRAHDPGCERRFARLAVRHGLRPFFAREAVGGDRLAQNAELAELLALAAELWLRLGRGEVQGQELFRASRWVEECGVDVRALALEGNLGLVPELAPPAGDLVSEWARLHASPRVEGWLAEYAGAMP